MNGALVAERNVGRTSGQRKLHLRAFGCGLKRKEGSWICAEKEYAALCKATFAIYGRDGRRVLAKPKPRIHTYSLIFGVLAGILRLEAIASIVFGQELHKNVPDSSTQWE